MFLINVVVFILCVYVKRESYQSWFGFTEAGFLPAALKNTFLKSFLTMTWCGDGTIPAWHPG